MKSASKSVSRFTQQESREVDQITEDDLRLFALGAKDANYLTDFYLRSPTSGTYWRKMYSSPDEEREAVWNTLNGAWEHAGKPEPIFQYGQYPYEIQYDDNGPLFFHRHGWLWQPWQKQAYHDPRPEQTIIGGFGCLDWHSRIWNEETHQYEAIGELYKNQREPLVLAWDGVRLSPTRATAPFWKGKAPLFKITTAKGRRITATGEHRFLTMQGYVALAELSTDDWILGCAGGDTPVWGGFIEPDRIVSIEYIGDRDFYDLHVPVHENYIAEGLVNHNSGKTAMIAVSLICMAMTIPGFRGFNFAPKMIQAQEVYLYIKMHFLDTPFWHRFVWSSPQKPYPKIIVRNSLVGESSIEIYSIEHDSEKIRTLEGDVAFIDQAEKLDNLDDMIRDIGSRLRGQIGGRERLGRLCVIANAGDNPQLWARYDQGEFQPEEYLSLNPSSYDNPYLTDRDRKNLKRRVSSDASEDEIDQWMLGRRPLGKGEHFPAHQVRNATDDTLDNIMDERIKAGDSRYIKQTEPKLHVYRWEMPPEDPSLRRVYCVIGDPGQGNPPDRNSAPIMVWDITNFPRQPAVMRAFSWVGGRGSYIPFVQEFLRYTDLYNARDRCGFDSTGVQKGFDELVFENYGLVAEGIDMAVGGKMFALNSLKLFMGRGLIKFPYLAHLGNQLTNYRLPDTKIRQDLVMCLAMSASFIRRYFYIDAVADEPEEDDSFRRVVDRYERSVDDRYERDVAR